VRARVQRCESATPLTHGVAFRAAAGFYFSPANDTAKSNLWLIYLEGGQARPTRALPPRPPL
jgi:hypothetical protein